MNSFELYRENTEDRMIAALGSISNLLMMCCYCMCRCNFRAMQTQLAQQRDSIRDLEEKIAATIAEMDKVFGQP